MTYYVVVDGYLGASGAYSLSIVCTSCSSPPISMVIPGQSADGDGGHLAAAQNSPSSNTPPAGSMSSDSLAARSTMNTGTGAPATNQHTTPSRANQGRGLLGSPSITQTSYGSNMQALTFSSQAMYAPVSGAMTSDTIAAAAAGWQLISKGNLHGTSSEEENRALKGYRSPAIQRRTLQRERATKSHKTCSAMGVTEQCSKQ